MIELLKKGAKSKWALHGFLFAIVFGIAAWNALEARFRYFDEGLVLQRAAAVLVTDDSDLKGFSEGVYKQISVPSRVFAAPVTLYFEVHSALCSEKQRVEGVALCGKSYAEITRWLFGGAEFSQSGHDSPWVRYLRQQGFRPYQMISSSDQRLSELGFAILYMRAVSALLLALAACFHFAVLSTRVSDFTAWFAVFFTFSAATIVSVGVLAQIPVVIMFLMSVLLWCFVKAREKYSLFSCLTLALVLSVLQFSGMQGALLLLLFFVAFGFALIVDYRKLLNPVAALNLIVACSGAYLLQRSFLTGKEVLPAWNVLGRVVLDSVVTLESEVPSSPFLMKLWLVSRQVLGFQGDGIEWIGVSFFFAFGLYCLFRSKTIGKKEVARDLPLTIYWVLLATVPLIFFEQTWDWLLVPGPLFLLSAISVGFFVLVGDVLRSLFVTMEGRIDPKFAPAQFAKDLKSQLKGASSDLV